MQHGVAMRAFLQRSANLGRLQRKSNDEDAPELNPLFVATTIQ